MTARHLAAGLTLLLTAAALCAVLIQRQKLATLRAERQQERLVPEAASGTSTEEGTLNEAAPALAAAAGVSPELLQLRSEVTRLKARQRALAAVEGETKRLRAQLDGAKSNAAAGYVLPQGYIRKSQAQPMGYSSPEKTIQTFLWALQNHDFTNVLQTLTPDAAQKLEAQIERSGKGPQEFFKETDVLPGFALQKPRTEPDGSISIEVQVTPVHATDAAREMPAQVQNFRFRQINGEWKLDLPF